MKYAEAIIPVLLTFVIAGILGLYTRIEDLEKSTLHRELLEFRLDKLEKDCNAK